MRLFNKLIRKKGHQQQQDETAAPPPVEVLDSASAPEVPAAAPPQESGEDLSTPAPLLSTSAQVPMSTNVPMPAEERGEEAEEAQLPADEVIEEKLRQFYAVYDPEKLKTMDKLVEYTKEKGLERLDRGLLKKYGCCTGMAGLPDVNTIDEVENGGGHGQQDNAQSVPPPPPPRVTQPGESGSKGTGGEVASREAAQTDEELMQGMGLNIVLPKRPTPQYMDEPPPPQDVMYKSLESALNARHMRDLLGDLLAMGVEEYTDLARLDNKTFRDSIWGNLDYGMKRRLVALVEDVKKNVQPQLQSETLESSPEPTIAPAPPSPLSSSSTSSRSFGANALALAAVSKLKSRRQKEKSDGESEDDVNAVTAVEEPASVVPPPVPPPVPTRLSSDRSVLSGISAAPSEESSPNASSRNLSLRSNDGSGRLPPPLPSRSSVRMSSSGEEKPILPPRPTSLPSGLSSTALLAAAMAEEKAKDGDANTEKSSPKQVQAPVSPSSGAESDDSDYTTDSDQENLNNDENTEKEEETEGITDISKENGEDTLISLSKETTPMEGEASASQETIAEDNGEGDGLIDNDGNEPELSTVEGGADSDEPPPPPPIENENESELSEDQRRELEIKEKLERQEAKARAERDALAMAAIGTARPDLEKDNSAVEAADTPKPVFKPAFAVPGIGANDEMRAIFQKRSKMTEDSEVVAKGDEPCDNFVLDVTATAFNTCRCGFPKTQHKTSSTPSTPVRKPSFRRPIPAAQADSNRAVVPPPPPPQMERSEEVKVVPPAPPVQPERAEEVKVVPPPPPPQPARAEEVKVVPPPPPPPVPITSASEEVSDDYDKVPLTPSEEILHDEHEAAAEEVSSQVANPEPIDYRQLVTEFYQKNNPEKLDTLDKILQTFEGREQVLLEKLEKKYNSKV